jgi:flagellar basal-body rod modification protein FlgD
MINAITGASTEVSTESISNGVGADQDMFLQLLVAQVRYQDPLEPMDNNEYMAQTAQFTMVEQMTKVAEQQTELIAFQQANLASGLIGKVVTGIDEFTGAPVSGLVSAVEYNYGDPQLIVDGERLSVDSIISTAAASTDAEGQTTEDTESADADSVILLPASEEDAL